METKETLSTPHAADGMRFASNDARLPVQVDALHVVIPDFAPPGWQWIRPPNADRDWHWNFYRSGREACAPAVRASQRDARGLLVSHGYLDARTCAKLRALRPLRRAPYIAFSFHAPFAFGRRDRFAYRLVARLVDRFVVHSDYERCYYSDELKVPLARFESMPWYYEEAEVEPTPIVDGPYIAAVGASMRDMDTLFAAMRRLPELRLVAVVRPENLVGLEVPDNVTVLDNIPKTELWNVQYHSRLHVLPLLASARSGHACLTQAMYFGRPSIVADVPCVADYITKDQTARTYVPGDRDDLARVIESLWFDDQAQAALGDAARSHALEHFSQRSMGDGLQGVIDRLERSRA